jgi:hypothetical protein
MKALMRVNRFLYIFYTSGGCSSTPDKPAVKAARRQGAAWLASQLFEQRVRQGLQAVDPIKANNAQW